jgi:hypothetical protein
VPVLERYLQDFPVLVRKFWLFGVDPADAHWLLSIVFAETFPDPLMWPALLGKTVTIAGKGASTIAEIAVHNFAFSGGAYLAVGIRLAAAIPDAAQGDMPAITIEDNTASITALADSLWKALRDVRWDGEIPALRWMPELQIGQRINLLDTNDVKMAAMAETIQQLSFDPFTGKTLIQLAANPWLDLDSLLRVVSQALNPQRFNQSSTSGGGVSGGGGMKVHKHNAAGANVGGNELYPKRFCMGTGATLTDDEFRMGENGVRIAIDSGTPIVVCGSETGDCAYLSSNGLHVKLGSRHIYLGNIQGDFGFNIDGIEYLFTHAGIRKLSAKVK